MYTGYGFRDFEIGDVDVVKGNIHAARGAQQEGLVRWLWLVQLDVDCEDGDEGMRGVGHAAVVDLAWLYRRCRPR